MGKRGTKARSLIERAWPFINKTDSCWLWSGHLVRGYGLMKRVGQPPIGAHRAVWEALVGPIPEGLDIDHLCRVRSCVNPAHLEPVTRKENILRGVSFAAVNAAKTHCPQGHEYNHANTRVDRLGKRSCRTCAARRRAALHLKSRASRAGASHE